MLRSLFGDLRVDAPGDAPPAAGDDPEAFTATGTPETGAGQLDERGQLVERNLRDLFVTGSPAQAMREHFAAHRVDPEQMGRWIVLLDPSRVWASAVVKALSDAGAQPVERLHLREQGTLRTLALIERTLLVRRLDEPLKVFHADVRATGRENAEISQALMERAQLAAVIVGPMQPHAIDALLDALLDAASQPSWRCPTLLFLLPPGAVWIANKVTGLAWPPGLQLRVLSEPMVSASAVWNSVLAVWDETRPEPRRAEPAPPLRASAAEGDFAPTMPVPDAYAAERAADEAPPAAVALDAGVVAAAPPGAPDSERSARVLARLADGIDGLLGCAVVDAASGLVLARESRDDGIDLELAAAACAQALRAQQQQADSMGLREPVDELLVGAGARQLVLRVPARHASLFVFALLDKARTNLALARLRLLEAERNLGA